jgi:acetyl-CoA acetyltransferase
MWVNSGTYFIGDKMANGDVEIADVGYLKAAAIDAYQQAGIEDPVEDFDVVEVYTPFRSYKYPTIEALGVCG